MTAVRYVVSPATRERQARFLKALVDQLCNIFRACKQAKISRQTYYRWYLYDEAFRMRYESARQWVLDDLEGELFSRARTSNKLLMFLLERQFPDVYGHRRSRDHTATKGLDPHKLRKLFTDDELALFQSFAKRAVRRQDSDMSGRRR